MIINVGSITVFAEESTVMAVDEESKRFVAFFGDGREVRGLYKDFIKVERNVVGVLLTKRELETCEIAASDFDNADLIFFMLSPHVTRTVTINGTEYKESLHFLEEVAWWAADKIVSACENAGDGIEKLIGYTDYELIGLAEEVDPEDAELMGVDLEEGERLFSYYIGSFVAPSGKYYTFYANSNVESVIEVAADMAWAEMMEAVQETIGGWFQAGEGDPTDTFFYFVMASEEEE